MGGGIFLLCRKEGGGGGKGERDLAVNDDRVAPLPVVAGASWRLGAGRRDGDDQVEPPGDVHAYRPVQPGRSLPTEPPPPRGCAGARLAVAAKRFYDRDAVWLLRVVAFDKGRERERAVLARSWRWRGGRPTGVHHLPILR